MKHRNRITSHTRVACEVCLKVHVITCTFSYPHDLMIQKAFDETVAIQFQVISKSNVVSLILVSLILVSLIL